ncbi:MAG: TIGR03086 family metal-binding protein [Acidimicrobiales bacterium]
MNSHPMTADLAAVRDLVNHVVSGNFWAKELTAGKTIDEVGDGYEGDLIGDDAPTVAKDAGRAASDAFSSPGAMEAMCAVSYGPIPGAVYCGHRIIDLVGHAWDLAVATSQDTALPDEQVRTAIEVILPQFEMLAGSGAFGDASDPGDAVALQTRLLSMLGRG